MKRTLLALPAALLLRQHVRNHTIMRRSHRFSL